MTHVTALRNSILFGFAVVAVAGCGAASFTGNPGTVPIGSSTSAPANTNTAAPAATPAETPDTSGINQQISGINSQLSTINGQLNAAGAGLSTNDGDPSK
jgi:Tfp pilus assembly protein PilW